MPVSYTHLDVYKRQPTDNPKYQDYISFKQTFGDDGNMLVIGIQDTGLFTLPTFTAYQQLHQQLKDIRYVDDILSVPGAVNLVKDSAGERLTAVRIFPPVIHSQAELDSVAAIFFSLPFYRYLLYNPQARSSRMARQIKKDILKTKKRTGVIEAISHVTDSFTQRTGCLLYTSRCV